MRIAMIGAGAMGAMFGARFAQAGADVVFYDRDAEHIAAILRDGLRLATPSGEMHLHPPATTDIAAIGRADLAIVLVDSNATREAAGLAAGIVGEGGAVFTLQNGIGNVEALVAAAGKERVIAGSTYNSAARTAPGRVLHSNIGDTVIGELDGRASPRIEEIARLFRDGGLPVTVSDNVLGHIWMKFVLNAAINPVSALTGLRPGEIARTEPARRLLESVLDEVLAVVHAKGIVLSDPNARDAVLDHAWERYNRPSMLQHVEQGKRTEIDALNGALLREAAALNIPCPVNETIVLAIKAIEARNATRAASPAVDEASLEAAARARPRPA